MLQMALRADVQVSAHVNARAMYVCMYTKLAAGCQKGDYWANTDGRQA